MKRNSPSPSSRSPDEASNAADQASKRLRPDSSRDDITDDIQHAKTGESLEKINKAPSASTAQFVDKSEKIPYQDLLKSRNRHRLPDKIMKCLDEGVEPDVLWWSPHENGFTVDSETVQAKLLDVHFRGTKLSSLVRSLNRWGFRRDFYRSLPKRALAFLHPKFKKNQQNLLREMKICSTTTQDVLSDSSEAEVAEKEKSSSSDDASNSGAKPAAVDMQIGYGVAPFNELEVSSAHQQAIGVHGPPPSPGGVGFLTRTHGTPQEASLQLARQHLQSGGVANPQISSGSQMALRYAGIHNPQTNSLQASAPFQANSVLDASLLQQMRAPFSASSEHQQARNASSYAAGLTGITGLSSIGDGTGIALALQAQQQQQRQHLLLQQQIQQQHQYQSEGLTSSFLQSVERSFLNQNQHREEQLLLNEIMLTRQREEDALRRLQLSSTQNQLQPSLGRLAASSVSQGASRFLQTPTQRQRQDQLYAVSMERQQLESQIQALLQAQAGQSGSTNLPPDDGSHPRQPPR